MPNLDGLGLGWARTKRGVQEALGRHSSSLSRNAELSCFLCRLLVVPALCGIFFIVSNHGACEITTLIACLLFFEIKICGLLRFVLRKNRRNPSTTVIANYNSGLDFRSFCVKLDHSANNVYYFLDCELLSTGSIIITLFRWELLSSFMFRFSLHAFV
jgi:hypothetical protein